MFSLFDIAFLKDASKKQKDKSYAPAPVIKKTEPERDINPEVREYINKYTFQWNGEGKICRATSSLSLQNIENGELKYYANLSKVNDIRFLNKFFETVHKRLDKEGIFIGCVETLEKRAERIFRKFPTIISYPYYMLDFILKRIFPKWRVTMKIYFFITKGRNRVLSKAETLGRLMSCGFGIINTREINNLLYFVVRKEKDPCFDNHPSYGPMFKMRRIGRGGRTIYVYKLRSMHPYAEYLQEYVYKKYGTSTGDKFDNDFRITFWGKFLRKLWLDELPMLVNWIKGDIKLIGVRPLSKHKLSIYPKYLQEKRLKHKPGLIPPFYADLPKTQEEFFNTEEKYIDAYEKHPMITDWKYFWKAIYNIIVKKARSS